MLPQLLPAVIMVLVAVAAGGSLAGLSRPIAWWGLGLASIALQLLLQRVPVSAAPWLGDFGHWVWTTAVASILLVLLRNWRLQPSRMHQTPWAVAALGVGLNLLVIVANGGYMPVSLAALEQTGQAAEIAARASFRRDLPVDTTTRMPELADVYADPAWLPHPVVASIGDRLLGVGLAGWAFVSVYATRRKRPRPGSAGAGERSAIQSSSAAAERGLLAK
jgi:uncharacterized protein DUF5317